MTHEEMRDTLSLYALGALDRAESEAVRKHLESCAECRGELAAEQHAIDALGRSTTPIRPRPELRARVLAAASGAVNDAPQVRALTNRLPWIGLAAAATIALMSSIGWVNARREISELQNTVAEWQARVANAEAQAARAANDATVQRRAVSVLTASDLVEATLAGVPPAAAARARAFLSPADGTLIFTAQGLPAVPAGRVYQLWAIVGSTAVSAGVFVPDSNGRSQLVTQLAPLAARPAAMAVTLEPEGGVPQPTGPKYLVGAPAN